MVSFSYASTKDKDVRYLVGRDIGDDFFLLITPRKTYIFLDTREIGLIEKSHQKLVAVSLEHTMKHAEKRTGKESLLKKVAAYILETYVPKEKTIGVSVRFPLVLADYLRDKGWGLEIRESLAPVRAIKTADEVKMISQALRKTAQAFRRIEAVLRSSVIRKGFVTYQTKTLTSEALKREVDKVFFEQGMWTPEGMIISSGKDSATAHHSGTGAIRAGAPVVCDLYPVERTTGYFADMTRTYVKGTPTVRLLKMYRAVEEAHRAALLAVKAGIQAREVHNAAADVLSTHGFPEGFTHAVGHGIGLEIHEAPRVGPHTKSILEPGNVITIEPGLYYPDVGGIRLEDVVVVTKNGFKNLTNYPKRFIIE